MSVEERVLFVVDEEYDLAGREELEATLVKVTPKLALYIDKNWWDSRAAARQSEIRNKLQQLSEEFERKIYPDLTSIFGSEWKPGVDGKERITILFHPLREEAGGYFRTADGYIRLQVPESNEREMFYLNIAHIDNPNFKAFIAHEFVHLITFNQKDRIYGVAEEVWLNEARAEYASTILGYDKVFEGSNLAKRAKIFLERPSDSIPEWQNLNYDYAAVNLCVQYLVDHYGIAILTDSLQSGLVGIASLNEALEKNGSQEEFSDIFTDWTIAVLVNDCSVGPRYCYLNENLKDIRVKPTLNFLPITGKSSLSVSTITKNWAGNWQKIIGGNGVLKLEFRSLAGLNFKVPYIIKNSDGSYEVHFLELDEAQTGRVYISDFGGSGKSLILVPSLQKKTSGFDGKEATFPFTFVASVVDKTPDQEKLLIEELLLKIEFLKKEIAKIQARIAAILGKDTTSCQQLTQNLSFGAENN
ncbi:hypothetical protein IIB49_03130, partial [Patescibacteria group bacterium]|nr:hypothetical protein [Patescibacteria group bacterium]